MGDVISFEDECPRIWVCECGCSTFYLQDDGEATCAHCDGHAEIGVGAWFSDLSEAEDRDQGAAPPIANVQGNGGSCFARRRIAQIALGGDTVAQVVVRAEGKVHVWFDASTVDQSGWIRKRLHEAIDLVRIEGNS